MLFMQIVIKTRSFEFVIFISYDFYPFINCKEKIVKYLQCWKSSPSSTEFLPSKWDGAKYSSPYLCSPWMDFDFQGGK